MTDTPATDRPPQDLDAIQTGQRWPSADDLRPHIGKWVATRAGQVILSADSVQEIVATLRSRDETADSMFMVPVDPTRDVIELDAAIDVLAGWLTSDATVERVARAMRRDHAEEYDPDWTWESEHSFLQHQYLNQARAGLAALAAALAPTGEAT